jgi:hypothetical protein
MLIFLDWNRGVGAAIWLDTVEAHSTVFAWLRLSCSSTTIQFDKTGEKWPSTRAPTQARQTVRHRNSSSQKMYVYYIATVLV